MGTPRVVDQYTPLDVVVTGVHTVAINSRAVSGYARRKEDFYQVTFGTTGSQWESWRDALVRGEKVVAQTDNKSLWSIELADNLSEVLQQEIMNALIEAHDRSLDSIG